jgi:hypothetical protein
MHTGSVFPRFIQMGALGVCKLSHLLIFAFQAQNDRQYSGADIRDTAGKLHYVFDTGGGDIMARARFWGLEGSFEPSCEVGYGPGYFCHQGIIEDTEYHKKSYLCDFGDGRIIIPV